MSPRKNPAAVALGKRGGKAKSPDKAEAARKNGQKGGRPPYPLWKRTGFEEEVQWLRIVRLDGEFVVQVTTGAEEEFGGLFDLDGDEVNYWNKEYTLVPLKEIPAKVIRAMGDLWASAGATVQRIK